MRSWSRLTQQWLLNKGILAIDEGTGACKKRCDAVGAEFTGENRRAYRGMALSTSGWSDHISGAILIDETIRQAFDDGQLFPDFLTGAAILPGIHALARYAALCQEAGLAPIVELEVLVKGD